MSREDQPKPAEPGGVAGEITCPHCDGSGFLYDETARTARDCVCRPRRIARRKAQSLAGVIPRYYRGVSFDRSPVTEINPHIVSEVRRYVDTLGDQLDHGRGIWFQGDVGTGKTTLAMLISAQALRKGHSVAIYSLPRLLGLLRQTFDDGSTVSLTQLIDRLTAVELLHLDDLGAQMTTPWVLEQLYSIVNSRYEDGKAIVATTNLSSDELPEQLGHRTVSRMIEICNVPLPMFGPDRRRDGDEGLAAPAAPTPAADRALRYGEQAPPPAAVRRGS